MNFYVYIIKTIKEPIKTYVGWTNNLRRRLLMHNNNKGAKSTKGRKWFYVYTESFNSKKSAMSREWFLKKDKKFRKTLRN